MADHSRIMRSIHAGKNSKPLLFLMLAINATFPSIVLADQIASSLCESSLTNILPPPYSNVSNLVCERVWNSYIIRYSQREDGVWTIILSTLYTTGWVGIGFSKDGLMVGSSAMVGWVNKLGHPRIKQYYIQGVTVQQVIPDKGELQLTNVPATVVLHEATLYLAFQIRFNDTAAGGHNVLLAFGTKYPSRTFHLTRHDDQTSLNMDFTRQESTKQRPSRRQKRRHGLLGLLGWGLFLPVGAMIARYFKHKDPLWFYLHTVIQFLGFLLIVANLVAGDMMYWEKDANLRAHRILGIFAFVHACLQVMAFFVRPGKESKMRKYWNWYHHWIGRLGLFYGAVNMMLGIQIAQGETEWKIGYGFLVGATLLAVTVLEVLSLLGRKEAKAFPPPTVQMNSIE
uniref:Cytochrome b561 and DOMON domain-containing protein n=1 Tax=Kalanchoe fedtschenkoi TaxID=63787 RepID=A0A7N0V9Y8_KALFE